MTNALLSGKKCIIVTGRLSNCDDIQAWISEILGNYTHMKSLWRVEKLENKEPDCEIGVLAFPQIYDEKVLAVNRPLSR
jgi:hypothetical protein